MKSLNDRIQNLQGQGVRGDVAARVSELFRQHPLLSGFSVQERSTLTQDRALICLDGEIYLADVALNIPPSVRVTLQYCEAIAFTLLDIMDGQPGASCFLVGRTFARTIH